MKIEFPHLEPWQKDTFEDIKEGVKDIYVVKAKRQCGKSILAITAMLYFAFKDRGISTCVEPTLNQGRRVFKQLLNAVGGENSPVVKSANSTLLTIEFKNGSEINFKSAEQGEALRGLTVKKGILVIDEAAFIQQDIFEILYPVVDACKCPILMISTPLFMSGEFYEKYKEGVEEGKFTKSYDWSTYDTSIFLSPEKLEYYRKKLTPLRFKSEYLGQFLTEGSYLFGTINTVPEFSTQIPKFAGIDWGTGQEGDSTVLTLLDDYGQITHIYSWNSISPTQQVKALLEIINSLSLTAVEVEMNSIGSVYADMLKEGITNGTYIEEFDTTNESKRRIIENLIIDVQSNDLGIPNNLELLHQMQHYGMEKTKTGITYNGQNGVNDDRVLSLAFARDAWRNNSGSFEIAFA